MRIKDTETIDVTIYLIQRQIDKDCWSEIEPAARVLGEDPDWSRNGRHLAPLAFEFSACGETWQKYAVHGTQNLQLAAQAFVQIVLHCPDDKFRLVKREYKINTSVVFEGSTPQLARTFTKKEIPV